MARAVAVIAGDGVVRVEVTERAGPGTPELRPVGRDAEGGRGLQLVAVLAARCGWRRRGGGGSPRLPPAPQPRQHRPGQAPRAPPAGAAPGSAAVTSAHDGSRDS